MRGREDREKKVRRRERSKGERREERGERREERGERREETYLTVRNIPIGEPRTNKAKGLKSS